MDLIRLITPWDASDLDLVIDRDWVLKHINPSFKLSDSLSTYLSLLPIPRSACLRYWQDRWLHCQDLADYHALVSELIVLEGSLHDDLKIHTKSTVSSETVIEVQGQPGKKCPREESPGATSANLQSQKRRKISKRSNDHETQDSGNASDPCMSPIADTVAELPCPDDKMATQQLLSLHARLLELLRDLHMTLSRCKGENAVKYDMGIESDFEVDIVKDDISTHCQRIEQVSAEIKGFANTRRGPQAVTIDGRELSSTSFDRFWSKVELGTVMYCITTSLICEENVVSSPWSNVAKCEAENQNRSPNKELLHEDTSSCDPSLGSEPLVYSSPESIDRP